LKKRSSIDTAIVKIDELCFCRRFSFHDYSGSRRTSGRLMLPPRIIENPLRYQRFPSGRKAVEPIYQIRRKIVESSLIAISYNKSIYWSEFL
jgi:hypothetical protein